MCEKLPLFFKLAITPKSVEVLTEVSTIVPQLKVLKSSKLNKDNITKILAILEKFTKLAILFNVSQVI